MLWGQRILIHLTAASSALGLAACKPSVGQPPSLISDDTLLAVRGEPAEVSPGRPVTYSFLLASPAGTVGDAQALWDICQTPKPPSESNAVASACTGAPDAGVASVGQTFSAPVPSKACQLFGPIAPPQAAGQPAVRPRDPDSTGGYYLPVQVWLPGVGSSPASGFAMERITCNLANAASTVSADFSSRYQANQDPAIDHVDLTDAGGNRLALDAGPPSLSAGAVVSLELVLAEGALETFPVYDVEKEVLVDQQETVQVSWFISGGSVSHDRTTVDATLLSSDNTWTLPSAAGTYFLWLVARDARGGTDWRSYSVEIAP